MVPPDKLSRIHWALFSTLTFAGQSVPRPQVRCRMLFQWLRQLAKLEGVPFELFVFLAREEQGEIGGRYHFHVLTGGPRSRGAHPGTLWANLKSHCFAAENIWRCGCGKSAGIAQVRMYQTHLSGVGYVLKGLDDEWSAIEANNYETARFRESGDIVRVAGQIAVKLDRQLIPARCLIRELVGSSMNRRRWKARERKSASRDRAVSGIRPGSVQPSRLAHPYAPGPGQGLI